MPYEPRVLPVATNALADVFSVPELISVAAESLNFNLQNHLPADRGTAIDFFRTAVDVLNRHDRLGDLINATREARPRSAGLVKVAEELALISSGRIIASESHAVEPGANLEKAVRPVEQKVDLPALRERLSLAEQRVGLVEVVLQGRAKGFGTAFLIGPDQVLTNWHVAEPIADGRLSPAAVHVRFDMKRDIQGKSFPGRSVRLADDWRGRTSPYAAFDSAVAPQPDPTTAELDFAVLRLADPIGEKPVEEGRSFGRENRGWFDIADHAAPPPAGEPLFVIGHPVDHPLTASLGKVLAYVGQGRRIRHDAWTLKGSSGSPVLDGNGQLIALHHGSEPVYGTRALYNQGIPMGLIAAALAGD